MPVRGSGGLVSSWSLLIRGILAALRQKLHLSTCPNLASHLFAEWIGIRHARAPMFGSEWYHGLCFVKPDIGIELLGQDGLAVVAPELCVGPVDHADEALQPRLREAAT